MIRRGGRKHSIVFPSALEEVYLAISSQTCISGFGKLGSPFISAASVLESASSIVVLRRA